jgi:ATP-binding cassette subfamily B protein
MALIMLMVASSLLEVFSIGAVVPFLGVLTDPERYLLDPRLIKILEFFTIVDADDLVYFFAVFFGFLAILAGTIKLALLWFSSRVSFMTGAELSYSMYRRTLFQSYQTHLARNSSQIINSIVVQGNEMIYGAVLPAINLVSSLILLAIFVCALLFVNISLTLIVLASFIFLYAIVIGLFKKKLLVESQRVDISSAALVKSLQESLGGIRDVLLDGSQELHCQIYRQTDLSLRLAQGSRTFMGQSPRYAMEILGMLGIACAAYLVSLRPGGLAAAIPLLGALALGAQKLLPLIQQIYISWASMRGSRSAVINGILLLKQPIDEASFLSRITHPIDFSNCIFIKDLWFRYQKEEPWVIKNANIEIKKGERVGFIGKTGSGKSTFLDILMGLLPPSRGEIQIDSVLLNQNNIQSWQGNIAHVPQHIFLTDASVAENIAFGVPFSDIDYERVRYSAEQAQLADVIDALPQKYRTRIGERGVRLSGGQRQRIGIARALYKKASLIIFDEATSALDGQTEKAIMDTIDQLSGGITILIIAHRLSTLRGCSKVFELSHHSVREVEIKSGENFI